MTKFFRFKFETHIAKNKLAILADGHKALGALCTIYWNSKPIFNARMSKDAEHKAVNRLKHSWFGDRLEWQISSPTLPAK